MAANTIRLTSNLPRGISFILLLLMGCASPMLMLTTSAEREDSTPFREFRELIPTPGIVFNTSSRSTVTVLFNAEARVSRKGESLQVQILIDGRSANPRFAVLTTDDEYTARTYSAFLADVPSGTHRVIVRWRVSAGLGFLRNRSLTVWATPE